MAKYAYKNKNVRYIYIKTDKEFIKEWNKLSKQSIHDIHLFLHGGPGKLYFKNSQIDLSQINSKTFNKLSVSGKIYLFSCNGGTIFNKKIGKTHYYGSVAGYLAMLFYKVTVRAVVNGSVYYRAWNQLFSRRPLTKERGAYWADFRYTKMKGKRILVSSSIGRNWYL